ncbi:MAG: hypothetical protein ACOCQE_04445 [Halanaerobium sp.]
MATAFGTVHGVYEGNPELDFEDLIKSRSY